VWIDVGLPSVGTDVYDTDVDEELSTNGTQQALMTLQKRTTPVTPPTQRGRRRRRGDVPSVDAAVGRIFGTVGGIVVEIVGGIWRVRIGTST
jgi:hypothetical protein